MSRYKINYKSKALIDLWVTFVNLSQCFIFCMLFFCVVSLILVLFNTEYIFLPSGMLTAVLFAVSFTVLMVMYARSPKDVEITDDEIAMHFGFYEMGRGAYAEFHKKIKLSDVLSCTVETEYKRINTFKFFMLQYNNRVYNETVWEIPAGQYAQPFVKIELCDNNYLVLPTENAEELCTVINEKICK